MNSKSLKHMPCNENEIKLAGNTISRDEIDSLCHWLQNDPQLTKGARTIEFEALFSEYVGVKHSLLVNSGSSANLLMAYSLLSGGYLRNKEVIVPAVSWVTTISPFIQLGFSCHLCDSDPSDLGVDLNHLEELLGKHRPSLLIVVHVLGHVNKMEEIAELCHKYDCLCIEDACEALGTQLNGRKTGNLSLAGSFSFYYGHHISTIEGGAVTTNDSNLYSIMLSIRSHGWSRDIPDETKIKWKELYQIDEFRELYSFYYPGFNFRSTDLSAFLGIGQLNKIFEIVEVRQANFQSYRSLLPSFWCQASSSQPLSSFAYGTFVANRLEVFHHLKRNGIECRPLVCGSMGRQPFWIKQFGETRLTVADQVHDYGIYLPNHASLSEPEIQWVAKCFSEVAKPFTLAI